MKIYENLDINNLNGEIWKVIKDFPDYQISNYGRVKSFKYNKINGKILKQNKRKEYLCVHLSKNGKSKHKPIHNIVYETFREKIKKNYIIHHINENKENNFFNNLESKKSNDHISYHHKNKILSENHKLKISKSLSGENHPNFKLTNQKIIDIQIDIEKGDLIQREIAKKHEVCQQTVSNIKLGKVNRTLY